MYFVFKRCIDIPKYFVIFFFKWIKDLWLPGPSCSKLTTSLVNEMFKFQMYCMQNTAWFAKQKVSGFCKSTHNF